MTLTQDLVFGVVTGSYIAIAAIGFTLVYGLVNMINFAHGEFMSIGAIVGVIVASEAGLSVSVVVTPVVLASALVGWAIAMAVFDPIDHTGPIPLLLTSIGLGLVLRNGLRVLVGAEPRYIEFTQPTVYRFERVGAFVNDQQLFVVGVALLCFLAMHLLLTRTTLGTALRAMADSEDLARITGVRVGRMRSVVWLLSAGLAGLAGFLLAVQRAASPTLGFDSLLLVLTAAILGGAGSVYGAIVGAYVLGIVIAVSVSFLPSWATELGTTLAFVVLILVLLLRPSGIADVEVRA